MAKMPTTPKDNGTPHRHTMRTLAPPPIPAPAHHGPGPVPVASQDRPGSAPIPEGSRMSRKGRKRAGHGPRST
jgi:hypothetical protein